MNRSKKFIVPLALAATLAGAPAATWADRDRHFRDHDIHHFHEHDIVIWRTGRWHHVWHDGHLGWWWVVGGIWYPYPRPIYPYPNPYIPPTVVVEQPPVYVQQQPAPPAPAAAPAQPQSQNWYYCEQSNGYYPYVRECPGGWKTVPAEPPPAPR